MGSGIGVGVGVGVDRSGLGVDCRTISGRVIFLTPVPAPAPLLVSAAVFVFAVVFVLVAMFISFCVLAIELPREILFCAAARVIPMAWIPICAPAFVVVCAPAFVVTPIFVALPGFIPICGALVELPLEILSLGAVVVVVV